MNILEYAQSITQMKKKTTTEWSGPCPFCGGEDRFTIFVDDKPGWFCRGCHSNHRGSYEDLIMRVESLSFSESCQRTGRVSSRPTANSEDERLWRNVDGELRSFPIIASYPYHDKDGNLIYRVIRYRGDKGDKAFYQQRPEPKNKTGWAGGIRGIERVPYRLPELLASIKNGQPIFIVEGEKAVDFLVSRGIAATTNTGGAGMGKKVYVPQYCAWFRGARVLVVSDNDANGAGQAHARMIAERLHGIAASVDTRLSGHWDAAKGQGLDDWIAAGGTLDNLPPLDAPTSPGNGDERIFIDYTDKNLPLLTEAVWGAITANPIAHTLFKQNGRLITVSGEGKNTPNRDMWTSMVASCIRLVETIERRGGNIQREKYPDPTLIKATMLEMNIPPSIRTLDRLVTTPVLVDDGGGNYRMILDAGYDEQSKTFYQNPIALPQEMGLEQAKAIILEDLLGDFPFASDADRANAVALLLLPFIRSTISGPTPMHLIEAAAAGTGKGLLVELLHIIWMDKPPTLTAQLPKNEDEASKILTSILANLPESIVFDNVNFLGSATLDMVLTARRYSGRILGKTEMTAPMLVNATWIATGNNVLLGGDIHRRIVPIRLVALEEDPSLRRGFRHANIRQWARQNRASLIMACLLLVAEGLNNTPHTFMAADFGSYEEYADVLGQILAGCEIEGFLGNFERVRQDDRRDQWRRVVSMWYETKGETPISAKDLYDMLKEEIDYLDLRGESERQQVKSLAMQLGKQDGKVYGLNGGLRLQIRKERDPHKKVNVFVLHVLE